MRWFQTTAIDYPNSLPHLGTAFEKVGADVQARYRTMLGYDVSFLMGNDENTVKVYSRATELGENPDAYCERMADEFVRVWRRLGVVPTKFVRTTDCGHAGSVREMYAELKKKGHVYDGQYTGHYCEGCEEYRTNQQVADHGGVCPHHKMKYTSRSEPAVFFALTKFADQIVALHRDNPQFIQPDIRRNEVVASLGELRDVCITRHNQPWGIGVPGRPELQFYVWFDALLSYLTFSNDWAPDVQFVGKDIARFHAVLWPALLMALGRELPKQVFAHGFIKVGDDKISKSSGNGTSLAELIELFGPDGVRYLLLATCPYPGDGEFSLDRWKAVYTADLVNTWGNLLSRTVALARKLDWALPANSNLDVPPEYVQHMERHEYHLALRTVFEQVLVPANKQLESDAPWKTVASDPSAARAAIAAAAASLRVASVLLKPFMPSSAKTCYESFSWPGMWSIADLDGVAMPYSAAAVRPTVESVCLFPRLK